MRIPSCMQAPSRALPAHGASSLSKFWLWDSLILGLASLSILSQHGRTLYVQLPASQHQPQWCENFMSAKTGLVWLVLTALYLCIHAQDQQRHPHQHNLECLGGYTTCELHSPYPNRIRKPLLWCMQKVEVFERNGSYFATLATALSLWDCPSCIPERTYSARPSVSSARRTDVRPEISPRAAMPKVGQLLCQLGHI